MTDAPMPFTHLDGSGHARMVDVTEKQPTVRAATAAGSVRCASASTNPARVRLRSARWPLRRSG